jgi:putative methionine-R-sulfoxide reductase with GAF domain
MPNDSPRGAAPTTDVDERLLRIEAVTDAALAHLDLDELLQALLERIAEALEADTCAFLLLDQSSNELIARAARGIEEEVEQGVRIPVGQGFAGRIAADRHPVIIEDVDHADVLNPILREKGIKSLLGVPLLVGGDILGVLHVGSLTPRDFTRDDAELLQLAADRAAYAIDHSRMYGETKRTAETLQRLQSITDAALTTMSLGDLLQELVDRVRDAIEVDTCCSTSPARSSSRGPHEASRRRWSRASASRSAGDLPAASLPRSARSCSRTSTTRMSSIRSCARRASSPFWARRSSRAARCSASSTWAHCGRMSSTRTR